MLFGLHLLQANLVVKNPSIARLDYIDIAKGVLVLLMVVYHSLNYTNQYQLAFRFLPFLPPSFILIAGYLISVVYAPRYQAGDRKLVPRLLVRGAKLLALFTALNVAAQFVRSPAYGPSIGVATFFAHWKDFYLIGSGYAAAFEVLLPIAYLLLLAPILLALTHRWPPFLSLTTFALVAGCVFLDIAGKGFGNLYLLSAGLVGMLAGRFSNLPLAFHRFFVWSLVAYIAYFPLGLAKGYVYVVQLLGACIALWLLCGLGTNSSGTSWWHRQMIRLGQYSLFAYIVQIAVLQILSRYVGRPDPWSVKGTLLLIITLVSTTLLVEMTHWMRTRSTGIERLYKAIFA